MKPDTPKPRGAAADSYVLTADLSGRGRRRAELVHVGTAKITGEIQRLLRSRMRAGALTIAIALSLWLVRDIYEGYVYMAWIRVGLIAFYSLSAALLYSQWEMSLRQLRGLEVGLFTIVAMWFAADRYHFTWEAATDGDTAALIFAVAFSVMIYFAFLIAYAIFVPNTWRRALLATGIMALVPIAVIEALRVREFEAYSFVRETLTFAQMTSMGLMLVVGVFIATLGTHRINALRREVFEAKQLGQYQLTTKIGSGGMGEVWEAKHGLLARPAAIKLIRPEIVDALNPDGAQGTFSSFEREAQATALLRSPHTVEVYDFGVTEDGTFYYVMELLDGLDFDSLVNRFGPVPPARAVYLLRQACESLADAHEQGLIHRDVKPANIFACHIGVQFDFVKILDFGLVKVWQDEPAGEGAEHRTPRLRDAAGTPAYLAPEVARGRPEVDERTDIYSLGCVGYWLLAGQQVFEGASASDIVAQQLREPPVRLSKRAEQPIPASLEAVIMRCLKKAPDERPSSMIELSELLAACDVGASWTTEDARLWWAEHMSTPNEG
jgi:serine/threonine-protein kinase